MPQSLRQRSKEAAFSGPEDARLDRVDDRSERGRCCEHCTCIQTLSAAFCDFVRLEAEDEDIVRADMLLDFYIRAVERANRQRSVERQFHIARARGFHAGG